MLDATPRSRASPALPAVLSHSLPTPPAPVLQKPLAPGSPAAVLDTHFRLLRQDFVEPLREAVLGYRKEQLTAQQEVRVVNMAN